MRAQLFDRVILEQLVCRRWLHLRRRRGFLIAEEDMVVRDELGLLQFPIGRIFHYRLFFLERSEERRLGNAIEIQVILPDELVDMGILAAPELTPERA